MPSGVRRAESIGRSAFSISTATTSTELWPTLPSYEWEAGNRDRNDLEKVWRERERLRRIDEEQRGL
jgi:hypothetical protein